VLVGPIFWAGQMHSLRPEQHRQPYRSKDGAQACLMGAIALTDDSMSFSVNRCSVDDTLM
jgi:hypothetical protein